MNYKIYECINDFSAEFDDALENERPYRFQIGEIYKVYVSEEDDTYKVEVIFQHENRYITMPGQTFTMCFKLIG